MVVDDIRAAAPDPKKAAALAAWLSEETAAKLKEERLKNMRTRASILGFK